MKFAFQTSLHSCLFAMFRSLSGGAAAALVFSCVYFSPLIDQKETIAAAALDHRGGGDRSRDRDDNGDRDGRGNDSDDDRSESSRDDDDDRAEQRARSTNDRQDREEAGSTTSIRSIILRRGGFSGDSEPDSGPLSEREERDAIQRGWQ